MSILSIPCLSGQYMLNVFQCCHYSLFSLKLVINDRFLDVRIFYTREKGRLCVCVCVCPRVGESLRTCFFGRVKWTKKSSGVRLTTSCVKTMGRRRSLTGETCF